jgi:hypothetical protein
VCWVALIGLDRVVQTPRATGTGTGTGTFKFGSADDDCAPDERTENNARADFKARRGGAVRLRFALDRVSFKRHARRLALSSSWLVVGGWRTIGRLRTRRTHWHFQVLSPGLADDDCACDARTHALAITAAVLTVDQASIRIYARARDSASPSIHPTRAAHWHLAFGQTI